MADVFELVDAFGELLKEYGADAEPYINIDRFWKDTGHIAEWRSWVEKHVSASYLPKFKFESDAHFRWHFRERDDPFLVLRGRSPDRSFDLWLRSIMVPKALHYHAEIAAAMKTYGKRNKANLKRAGCWSPDLEWKRQVERVLEFGGIISADRRQKIVDDRSIQRWASSAESYRKDRLKLTPPSAWRIDSIELEGDKENGLIVSLDHLLPDDEMNRKPLYRETWVWDRQSGIEPPQWDSWTFSSPASYSLWLLHWRAKKGNPPGGLKT